LDGEKKLKAIYSIYKCVAELHSTCLRELIRKSLEKIKQVPDPRQTAGALILRYTVQCSGDPHGYGSIVHWLYRQKIIVPLQPSAAGELVYLGQLWESAAVFGIPVLQNKIAITIKGM
jgi:hypothetical protein